MHPLSVRSLPARASGAGLALSILVLAVTVGLAGCKLDGPKGSEATAAPAPPPPPVTVARPVRRVVTQEDEYVGRFVAVEQVEARARVSGYLEAVHFQDGQMVEKGDLLFSIDKRPFEAALTQARAQLEQAKANLAFAENNLERAEGLKRGTVISEQSLDERVQARRGAQSAVSAQEAAVRQAELDLEFTALTAPISGRIGDRRVSPGNLVTGGSGGSTTLLATIRSVDPIRFEFTIDEASYLRFVRMHGIPKPGNADVPVRLRLIDEETFARQGRLEFVDNALDRSSGSIRLRAEFPNPDGLLTPGMFGRVRVAAAPPAEALMVPDKAIGTEQVRKFVMVVGEDGVANPKYVELGSVIDGLRVITSGLAAEDRVIINGLMRARPGSKVTAQEGAIVSASAAGGPGAAESGAEAQTPTRN